jgi:hypothetical protein
MSNPGQQFLASILDQVGDRVKFSTEVASTAADSATWDSSELVEWAANRAGAKMPDGSWRQYNQLNADGHGVDPEVALRTPGALLFKFSSDPKTGIPNERQVVISLGDGRVVDASGKQVSVVAAEPGDFTHAATVPAFALEPSEVANVRDFVNSRIGNADGTPFEPVASPPAESKTSTDDAVTLRKQALDASQHAQELRERVSQGEKYRDELESNAADLRRDAQARLDESAKATDPNEAARLKQEGEKLNADAAGVEEQLGHTRAALDSVRGEAAAAQNEATALFTRSHDAIDAKMPSIAIAGKPADQDVAVVDVPPNPTKGASLDDLRSWVAQRELAESSREDAAAQKFRSAAQLEDLAEVKTSLAADAQVRADAMAATIEAEQTRIVGLEARLTAARAQRQRLFEEMEEQQRQFEALKAKGDPAAATANARTDELMRQEMSWSSQAHALEERVKAARESANRATDDRADFEQVAANLREEATRARDFAAREQAEGDAFQADAERLDRETDMVESAISRGVATHLVIQGEGVNIELDIPGRSPSDLTPEEIDDLDLPGSEPKPSSDATSPKASADSDAEPASSTSPSTDLADPVAVDAVVPAPSAQPEALASTSLESEVAAVDASVADLFSEPEAPDVATLGDVTPDALSDVAAGPDQLASTDDTFDSAAPTFENQDGLEPDLDDSA